MKNCELNVLDCEKNMSSLFFFFFYEQRISIFMRFKMIYNTACILPLSVSFCYVIVYILANAK